MSAAALGMLDTSVVIDMPADLSCYAASVGVPAVVVGELAFGLHVDDPIKSAEREQRYRDILATYDPVPYGAIARIGAALSRRPYSRKVATPAPEWAA